MADTVTIPVGDRTANGYLALPEQGKGPAILALHAWWGLNDFFKSFCDRLAAEGSVVLAPDLYHGKLATTIEEAENLRDALDDERATQDVMAAIDFLVRQPATSGSAIAAIGFSLGSSWALSLKEPVKAIVTFYGLSEPELIADNAIVLGHFGEDDAFEPLNDVRQFEAALHHAGKDATIYTYPGAQHWFFEQDRVGYYDPEAAQLAWERTIEFLRRNL